MSNHKYHKEFKQTIIDLLNSGKSILEVCEEYELKKSTVYKWQKEFKTETGAFKDEATLSYEQEIKRLKKELKEAQLERDILKKAVSIFSKRDGK